MNPGLRRMRNPWRDIHPDQAREVSQRVLVQTPAGTSGTLRTAETTKVWRARWVNREPRWWLQEGDGGLNSVWVFASCGSDHVIRPPPKLLENLT